MIKNKKETGPFKGDREFVNALVGLLEELLNKGTHVAINNRVVNKQEYEALKKYAKEIRDKK